MKSLLVDYNWHFFSDEIKKNRKYQCVAHSKLMYYLVTLWFQFVWYMLLLTKFLCLITISKTIVRGSNSYKNFESLLFCLLVIFVLFMVEFASGKLVKT